tara:strand:- start:268 stop:453 length:186 start_codon:yes stop_codon:yes gene_type:complete
MIRMTLTKNEIVDLVTTMQEVEPELNAEDMQVALAEYEYHEENWETLESDDSHIDLYQDEI